MCFMIFYIEKPPLKTIKIGFFHGFGQKLAIFRVFILVEIGKKYLVYDTLERRDACVDNKNNK